MAATKWPVKKISRSSEDLSSDFPDYEVVKQKLFNQTAVDGNNNKFFSLEQHKCSNGKYRIYTHYGRVHEGQDDHGAYEIRGPGTLEEMEKVFNDLIKDKTNRKDAYQEISFIKAKVGSPKARLIVHGVNAAEIPVDKKAKTVSPMSKLAIKIDAVVANLVQQIYGDAGAALQSFVKLNITKEGFETPLGILTFKQIDSGKEILLALKDAISSSNKEKIKKLTSQYYSLIPHKLGYKITDEDLISKDEDVQKASDVLQLMRDSLEIGSNAYLSDDIVVKYKELGAELNALSPSDPEYKRIVTYISSTISDHHRELKKIKVKNVFAIKNPSERSRYEKCLITNEQELFHGSRNCNIAGIARRGLLIAPPEAPRSGLAFGRGTYFADQSSKSLNYSLKSFGKAPTGNSCYLFLTKVKLGKMLELEDGRYDADEECRRRGCQSTFGKKGYRLLHNEFITYTLEQNTLTYLVELDRPIENYYG